MKHQRISKRLYNYQIEVAERKASKWKVRKGDTVKVISGDNRGKDGVISLVIKRKMLVCVEGSGFTIKGSAKKKSEKKKGILVHVSNVKKLSK